MKRTMYIDMTYFNVYYYCSIINNIVMHYYNEFLPNLSEFFEMYYPDGIPNGFQKESILHNFCEWCISRVIDEDMDEEVDALIKNIKLLSFDEVRKLGHLEERRWFSIESAMDAYHMESFLFVDWLSSDEKEEIEIKDAFYEYNQELLISGTLEELISKIAHECFYILFMNRTFLLQFNMLIIRYRPEIRKRVNIPDWVRKAVTYRDRCRCVCCHERLENDQYGIDEPYESQFDHMVALSSGGLNDVTNIQLLCATCNNRKDVKALTNSIYQDWYLWEE